LGLSLTILNGNLGLEDFGGCWWFRRFWEIEGKSKKKKNNKTNNIITRRWI